MGHLATGATRWGDWVRLGEIVQLGGCSLVGALVGVARDASCSLAWLPWVMISTTCVAGVVGDSASPFRGDLGTKLGRLGIIREHC